MEPLFEKLRSEADANRQRIILPESFEPRTLTAANRFLEEQLAEIILLGNAAKIQEEAQKLGLKSIDKATFIDPDDPAVNQKYGALFYELRKNKGITMEQSLWDNAEYTYRMDIEPKGFVRWKSATP